MVPGSVREAGAYADAAKHAAASQNPGRPAGPGKPGLPGCPAAPSGPLSPSFPSMAWPGMPGRPKEKNTLLICSAKSSRSLFQRIDVYKSNKCITTVRSDLLDEIKIHSQKRNYTRVLPD